MLPLDLRTLRSAYASGTLTPSSIVDELLRQIKAYDDPAVWIHLLSRDRLLAHAKSVESRGRESQPLYGVPFAIKDNIDLAGVPTTAGCPAFAYTPSQSAIVVQRLIDAGAIPIGKTNLDQFATGLVGVRSPYGIPRNPFRADVIPGGSSSGSAVAVAAKLVSFALGTDTAGSGRVPAGLNDIVGLKPTRGALSTRGVVPACRSLDCVSVFAPTCEDAAAILAIADAFDPADPFARRREVSLPHDGIETKSNLRIGVPRPDQLDFCGDREAERLFGESLGRIDKIGAIKVEIDFAPFREAAALLYQGPWVAERWLALRDFHRSHADAFHPVTRQIVEAANGLSAADAFAGMYKLAELARRAAAEWDKMDALLVPTAPRPFTVAEILAEPIQRNTQLGTYTNFVNLLDLAALAVPAGFRLDGVPWGVTFIAPAWSDARLLEIGTLWEADVRYGTGSNSAGELDRKSQSVVRSTYSGVGGGNSTRPALEHSAPTTNYQLQATPRDTAIRLAVVGAHLSGLPLNHQLVELGARLVWTGTTAPQYRLLALPNTSPAKPGLKRVEMGGSPIAVEVWELSPTAFGTFVAGVPSPMCIGTVALATGETVKGFLCEPLALEGAQDITEFGGWRGYIAARQAASRQTVS